MAQMRAAAVGATGLAFDQIPPRDPVVPQRPQVPVRHPPAQLGPRPHFFMAVLGRVRDAVRAVERAPERPVQTERAPEIPIRLSAERTTLARPPPARRQTVDLTQDNEVPPRPRERKRPQATPRRTQPARAAMAGVVQHRVRQ